jgi:hypothetical protein
MSKKKLIEVGLSLDVSDAISCRGPTVHGDGPSALQSGWELNCELIFGHIGAAYDIPKPLTCSEKR